MCFHRRLIFGLCNHHAWLTTPVQPCKVEEAFERGDSNTGCGAMWSHPLQTVRVPLACARCAATRADHDYKLGVVKGQLKVLREHLMLIRGASEEDGGEKKEEGEDGTGSAEEGSTEASTEAAAAGTENTVDTDPEWLGKAICLEEIMDEVSYDPKHRPLGLPLIVAARRAQVLAGAGSSA